MKRIAHRSIQNLDERRGAIALRALANEIAILLDVLALR